jgi:hypothetical protein
MYSQLLPEMAAERVSDMRREAKTASRARRSRPARPGHAGHRAGRHIGVHGPDGRMLLRTARP